MSVAACNRSVYGGMAQSLTITLAARYTGVHMQPRNNLGPAVGCSVIEMRRGKVWARSNFSEAVMFNFILPIKEDA